MTDPVSLLQDLVRCKSVTPDEGGALNLLQSLLSTHGFDCHRLVFSDDGTPDVDNLYARFGTTSPHFCFAGHTDVVPTGDPALWRDEPFVGIIRDGFIYGRGTTDMKGAVAAFAAAACNFVKQHNGRGSISLLITGDEEGPAINGTKKVLEWMSAQGEAIDFCLVGEPTSRDVLGDMIKIGRRGTLTGTLAVDGIQGHVAYPHLADNPIPKLMTLLTALENLVLDNGTMHFDPSNLEIVKIHAGDDADNVIPPVATATFNVRFNDTYTGDSLSHKLRNTLDACALPYRLHIRIGGESFYTPPDNYAEMVKTAIEQATGITPVYSTTGGTSDARFIRAYCPVIEFGAIGKTAHQIDECADTKDIITLSHIYADILHRFFIA